MHKSFTVVGIGASAGGLKALEELFRHLSDSTGQAFVIVQHLSRKHTSLMDQILGRDTHMPVCVAEDGMAIEPNHVYLIPAGKVLTTQNYQLKLDDQDNSQLPSYVIDRFFDSLGLSLKEHAIGIILSGTGSDGARGIRTIKEQGGITLVQDPKSGQFEGMPNSAIQTQMVDFVLSPRNIGRKLSDLPLVQREINYSQDSSKNNQVAGSEPVDKHFHNLLELLYESKGVNFFNYKVGTLKRRIEKNMLIHEVKKLEAFVSMLKEHPLKLDQLFRDILINVTEFFRDREAFAAIEKEVFPHLFSLDSDEEIRIWHCGCSTGEEVYSLLMMIHDYCQIRGIIPNLKILATDLDDQALASARLGRYPASLMEGVSEEHLSRYFDYEDNAYVIKNEIRNQVIFSVSDATNDPPFIRLDMIICRNMLIYLKPETQEKLFLNFHFALKPGKFLWLGTSETILKMSDNFSKLNSKWRIFRRKGFTPTFNKGYAQPRIPQENYASPIKEALFPLNTRSTIKSRAGFINALLDKYVNSCVVINAQFKILFIAGNAGNYLKFQQGISSMSLLSVIPKALILVVKDAIKRLNKGEGSVLYPGVFPKEGESKGLDLVFDILQISKTSPEVYYLLEWREPHADQLATREPVLVTPPDAQETMDLILELQEELQYSHHEVQTFMEELETSNEELQASNEELQASNEELQSTNEELQSVNEELHTVNHELEERNKELDQLYKQVDYLLNSIGVTSLLLDQELKVQFFTPSVPQYVPLKPTDIHRKITDFSFWDEFPGLLEEIRLVMKQGKATDNKIHGKNAKQKYWIQVNPFLEASRKISGVVISFYSTKAEALSTPS